jgi:hypothetical protein
LHLEDVEAPSVRDAQPAPLADGEPVIPAVASKDATFTVNHLPLSGKSFAREGLEDTNVGGSRRDEADLLAFLLRRVGKPEPRGQRAHLALEPSGGKRTSSCHGSSAKRKYD